MGLVVSVLGRLFIFLVFASPGLFFLFIGLWRYQMYRRVSRLQSEPPHDEMSGVVQAEGEARPLEGTTPAPITRTDAVGYEMEIESYVKGGGPDSNGWHTVTDETELPLLELQGLADSVAVDPSAFERSLTSDYETVVETADDITPEVREFFERDGTVDLHEELGVGLPEVTEDRKLRLTERRIEPGEELLVVGHAAPRSDPVETGPETEVGEPQDPGTRKWLGELMLLTDKSELEAASTELDHSKTALWAGGIWVALASFVLVGPLIEAVI